MAPTALCKTCQGIVIHDEKVGAYEDIVSKKMVFEWDGYELELDCEHHDTYPDLPGLESSANTGCGFCQLLRDAVRAQFSACFESLLKFPHDTRSIVLNRFRYLRTSSPERDVSVDAPLDTRGRYNGIYMLLASVHIPDAEPAYNINNHEPLIFDVLAKADDPIAQYLRIWRRPLSGPLLSLRNVDRIKGWIKECEEGCELCSTNLKNYLPTRLIDVGYNNEQRGPRLIETANEPTVFLEDGEVCNYLALSYCWGLSSSRSSPPLRTQKSNLAKMLHNIPMSEIPRTLQDAITVTRALKLRYLWIDSLCIIQDDDSDWQKESARMADTYSHSYITIAAASSRSSHDGFLSRKPYPSLEIPYASTNNPNIFGTYFLSPRFVDDFFFEDVLHSVWSTRGWTLQEYLLSRRVLYFCARMLHFECYENRRHEFTSARFGPRDHRWRHTLQPHHDKRLSYGGWYDVIEDYSRRELTFVNDVLPAASGLAHDMARGLGLGPNSYLAGLWREDLHLGLLWYTFGGKRSDKYLGPSWSWVCYRSVHWIFPVRFRFYAISEQCQVWDARTIVLGENPMGPVTSGYLIISGKLRCTTRAHIAEAQLLIKSHVNKRNEFRFDRAEELEQIEDIWMLSLVRAVRTRFDNSEENLIHGLLLVSVEAKDIDQNPQYRRIGMFSLNPEYDVLFPDAYEFLQKVTII